MNVAAYKRTITLVGSDGSGRRVKEEISASSDRLLIQRNDSKGRGDLNGYYGLRQSIGSQKEKAEYLKDNVSK